MTVSDVPACPIHQLIDAMLAATRGDAASVWWHLEPDGYFLRLEPCGARIHLQLDFSASSEAHRSRRIASCEADARLTLLALWRFVRKFQSGQYGTPHWPLIDGRDLDLIKTRIMRIGTDVSDLPKPEAS